MNKRDYKNAGAARYQLIRKDGQYHLSINGDTVVLSSFDAAVKRMKDEEHARQCRQYIVCLSFSREFDPDETEIIHIKALNRTDAVFQAQYQVAENQALAIEHGGEVDGEIMFGESPDHPNMVDRFYFTAAFVWDWDEMVAVTDGLQTIELWEQREQ